MYSYYIFSPQRIGWITKNAKEKSRSIPIFNYSAVLRPCKISNIYYETDALNHTRE